MIGPVVVVAEISCGRLSRRQARREDKLTTRSRGKRLLGLWIELPLAIARCLVQRMRAYFSESNSIEHDEIAARQLDALRQHYSCKLRLTCMAETLVLMWDYA